jgi:hypothetical protein
MPGLPEAELPDNNLTSRLCRQSPGPRRAGADFFPGAGHVALKNARRGKNAGRGPKKSLARLTPCNTMHFSGPALPMPGRSDGAKENGDQSGKNLFSNTMTTY